VCRCLFHRCVSLGFLLVCTHVRFCRLVRSYVESEGFRRWCITFRITGFLGFVHLPGILNTRKHNVSETGSISVLRSGEGDTYSVGSSDWGVVLSKGPNRGCVSLSSPEDGNTSSVFSSIQNSGRWTSPATQ
jgi:hypothetical protein